jgi:hypothetical protein
MAKTLNKIGITTGNTVQAYHVSQSIDAFAGIEEYDIHLSGSFNLTGSLNIANLPTTPKTNIVTYDPVGKGVFTTSSVDFLSPLSSSINEVSSSITTTINNLSFISGSGTTNYIAKFTPNGTTLGDSVIYDNGTNIGLGTTTPTELLHVNGNIFLQTTSNRLKMSNNGDIFPYSSTPFRGIFYDAGSANAGWRGAHRFRISYEGTNYREGLFIQANADTTTSNIGINSIAPTAQLHIAADSALSSRSLLKIRDVTDSFDILRIEGNGSLISTGGGGIDSNTSIGQSALVNNTTGTNNVAVGKNSLENNDVGITNTAIGFSALNDNISGNINIGIGNTALGLLTSGDYNIGIGNRAGHNIVGGAGLTTSDDSIFIGNFNGANASGETNQIVIGSGTLLNPNYGNGSNTVTLGNNSITNTFLKGVINLNNVGVTTATTLLATDVNGNIVSGSSLLPNFQYYSETSSPDSAKILVNTSDLSVDDSSIKATTVGASGSFFYNQSNSTLSITNTSNEATDNITVRTDNGKGIIYNADYSSTFVSRSLVDKEYVDTKNLDTYSLSTSNTPGIIDVLNTTVFAWQVEFDGNKTLQIDNFNRGQRLKINIINTSGNIRNFTIEAREGTSGSYTTVKSVASGGGSLSNFDVRANGGGGDYGNASLDLTAFYFSATYSPSGTIIGNV